MVATSSEYLAAYSDSESSTMTATASTVVNNNNYNTKKECKPIRKKQSATICRWSRSIPTPGNGVVVPSDQAFCDAVLDGHELESRLFSDLSKYLILERRKSPQHLPSEKHTLCFLHGNYLYYKDELVWQLETYSYYSADGSRGQSSTCVLNDGKLRLTIHYKGKRSTGDGWNAKESRWYSITDILRKSLP